jgi:DNA mismatch endonuclease, patch repair protein
MADVLTPEQRHRNMANVRSKNSKPELIVRKLVFGLGYRYRLHRRDLPGTPDLTFPSQKKVIFVHGCFWHMHKCRFGKVVPKTNASFWHKKRLSNVIRDKKNLKDLKKLGWKTLIIWECQARIISRVQSKIVSFLT